MSKQPKEAWAVFREPFSRGQAMAIGYLRAVSAAFKRLDDKVQAEADNARTHGSIRIQIRDVRFDPVEYARVQSVSCLVGFEYKDGDWWHGDE